jgi:hypothetical protein
MVAMWRKNIGIAALIAVIALLLPSLVRAEAPSAIKEIELTDAQVQGYVAAKRDLQIATADPKSQPEYEAIAKKHGFSSFNEFSEVGDTIAIVMIGLDDKSVYTDPKATIEQDIAKVAGDKDMSTDEKATALQELTEALKMTTPIKFPRNIEIVRKYQVDIEKVM